MSEYNQEEFIEEYKDRLAKFRKRPQDVFRAAVEVGIDPTHAADAFIEEHLRFESEDYADRILEYVSRLSRKASLPAALLYDVYGTIAIENIGLEKYYEFCRRLRVLGND